MSPVLHPTLKPQRPRAHSPLLYILLAAALLALPRTLLFPRAQRAARHYGPCGRIVLVSAARHGSTWFVDSAEGCTARNGSFGRLNAETELWNPGQYGPIRDLEPRAAALYAKLNRSLKIFPPALDNKGPLGVRDFFEAVKELRIPVFVLRRSLADSYESLMIAKATAVWNVSRVGDEGKPRNILIDRGLRYDHYIDRIMTFFDTVTGLMDEVEVVWDEVNYEDVSEKESIIGERNKCRIRNCNFARSQTVEIGILE